VEPFRAGGTRAGISGLACLTAVLMGIIAACQLSVGNAAEPAASGTAVVAVPGPASDRSLSPALSDTGPVVFRGTRPASPKVGQPVSGAGNANVGFRPVSPYGSGWNNDYDFGGLNYSPATAPQ
jgi:hypothetical protein